MAATDVDLNPFRMGTLSLAPSSADALRALARSLNTAPTAECTAFVKRIVSALSDASGADALASIRSHGVLARASADAASTGLEAFVATVADFAKCATPSSGVRSALEDAGFSAERAEMISDAIAAGMDGIRLVLETKGIRMPRLVDVRWNLEYVVSDSDVGRVGRPSYTVAFVLEEDAPVVGGAPVLRTHSFTCTPQELDDLNGRVKEALRAAAPFAGSSASTTK